MGKPQWLGAVGWYTKRCESFFSVKHRCTPGPSSILSPLLPVLILQEVAGCRHPAPPACRPSCSQAYTFDVLPVTVCQVLSLFFTVLTSHHPQNTCKKGKNDFKSPVIESSYRPLHDHLNDAFIFLETLFMLPVLFLWGRLCLASSNILFLLSKCNTVRRGFGLG